MAFDAIRENGLESVSAINWHYPSKITVGNSANGLAMKSHYSDAKKIADHESAGFIPVGWVEGGGINGFLHESPKSRGSARRQSQPVGLGG